MKRFDDYIIFNCNRFLDLKRDYTSLLFREADLSKGISSKSRKKIYHFLGSLVGNLVESFIFQRNLAIRISDIELSSVIKNKILNAMMKYEIIDEIRKGYFFKESSLDIPKSDLTKIKPNPSILDVFNPEQLKPSKSWSVILRKNNKEISVKTLSEEHALLYRCALKFQKHVNVPIRSFKRIFNGDLESGGRVYSNYQQMSKNDRSLIKIDGEKTIELDYPYNQIRILFSLFDIKDEGDPYSGFDEDREIVKKAMHVLLNSENPKRVLCDGRLTSPFRWTSKKADSFISEVYSRYPILKKMEGSGIGLKLQKIEGDIVLAVMKDALYNNKVALPVHDSFIVKESEVDYFRCEMKEAWNRVVDTAKKRNFLT